MADDGTARTNREKAHKPVMDKVISNKGILDSIYDFSKDFMSAYNAEVVYLEMNTNILSLLELELNRVWSGPVILERSEMDGNSWYMGMQIRVNSFLPNNCIAISSAIHKKFYIIGFLEEEETITITRTKKRLLRPILEEEKCG